MKIEYASDTHPGLVREHNEDAILALPEQNLFVVADGMGGHRAGDVASRTAIESISEFFRITADCSATWPYIAAGIPDPRARRLVSAIQYAHLCLGRVEQNTGQGTQTMGTTIVALHFAGSLAFLAHVGDCRCYCYCQNQLRQLTRDHTMVADMRSKFRLTPQDEVHLKSYRHVVTRALGAGNRGLVEVDTRALAPHPGDLFLLCSDGLHSEISDADLAEALREQKELQTACQNLLGAALRNGGHDNISAVLVRYVDGEPPAAFPPEAEDTQTMTDEAPFSGVLIEE